MKKVYSSIAALFVGIACLTAQSITTPSYIDRKLDTPLPAGIKQVKGPSSLSATARWYNYYEVKDALAGGNSGLNGNYLFPDSNIMAEFSGGTFATPWVHNIGTVLDPTAFWFNDPLAFAAGELLIRPTDSYNVDSVGIWFGYYRKLSSAIVDTLIVEVSYGAATPGFAFAAGSTNTLIQNLTPMNPGLDSVMFINVPYTPSTNAMNLTPKAVYKLPLDSAYHANDSVFENIFYWQFSTAGSPPVAPGRFVYTNVWFKPGYSYSLNDTIASKNYARLFSWQENGNGTAGAGTFPRYMKRDWNLSSIIETSVKYRLLTPGSVFYDRFVGSFAYMGGTSAQGASYGFENHWINFKLSCGTCDAISTNDIDKNISKLGAAYPNPAQAGESVIIPITLAKAGDAKIKIFNAIGQEVRVITVKDLTAGLNNITVNTATFNQGVYLYSLELNGKITATQRFSVVK